MADCLYCPSDRVVKNGTLPSGAQRYRCGDCDKQFSIGGTRPSYTPDYIDNVVHKYCHEGWKVKEVIKEFGLSTRTLIKWKKAHIESCPSCLGGEVE